MILSDLSIKEEIKKGNLKIKPFILENLQPSSFDLLLGNEFRIFKNLQIPFIDIKNPVNDFMELVKVENSQPLVIHPKEFILGTSVEWVKIPHYMVGRLEGKSSLGRLGIIIHSTAGYIDPGFSGQITFEMSNLANLPIALYPGMKVAQLSFHYLTTPVEVPYGRVKLKSKYQYQKGPTPSHVFIDFRKNHKTKK